MENKSKKKLPKNFIPINFNFSELKGFQDLENRIHERINKENETKQELYNKIKEKEYEHAKWLEEHKEEIQNNWQEQINKNLKWLEENPEKKKMLIDLFNKNKEWGLSLSEEDGYIHDAYGPMSFGRLSEPEIVYNRYIKNIIEV